MQQPLTWIRSFEVTARHGNFTHAAEELGLSQAAVSQHIKALEVRLGVQLFERQTRGVKLSGVGAELYRSVAEGIGTIEAALERFGQINQERLHVLSNTSLAVKWLTPRLPEFLADHPNLDFRLSTALWQTDAIGVKADISLFLAPSKGQQGTLTKLTVGDMVVVEPTTRRVEKLGIVQVTGYQKMFDALRKATLAGDTAQLRLVECDSFHTALDIASAGIGRTIVPRLLANRDLAEGTLRAACSWKHDHDLSYWARLNTPGSEINKAFVDWVASRASHEMC